jgi:RNA polymerase sigma factor (sigma-70 family)
MATIRPETTEVSTAPLVVQGAVSAAGDQRAHVEVVTFESVYRDEYDPMVRVAFLLVRNLESAEEIVQDAFVRLHLRWDRVATPGAFLRTCVVNGCRDRLRRRGRLAQRLPLLAGDVTGDLARGAAPAGELHDVLARLPLSQRTALVGRFYGGWDDAAIADALGVRPATVRSLVHRGLAALRTELDP